MINRNKFISNTFIILFVVLNLIGYVLNIDILRVLSVYKSGFGISFIPIIIPAITSYIIYNIFKSKN